MIAPIIDWSSRLFGALFTISWQAAVIALLILAAQLLFRRRLPARWRYALWFLVIARLLLPTLPESPVSWQHVVPAAPIETSLRVWADQPALFTLPPPPALASEAPASSVKSAPGPLSTLEIVGLVWLAGVVVLSSALLFVYLRFRRSLRHARAVTDQEMLTRLQACAADVGFHRAVRLLEIPGLSSPAVFGFLRPTLLIPKGFATSFTPEEQRMIFLHEVAHIRRWDIPVNTLLTVLQVLHWFNPVLWYAFRRLRFDRECATDALALAGPRATSRSLYGNTLLKLVERFSAPHHPSRLLGILENKRNLRARFLGIRHAHAGAYRWSLLGVALILLIGVVTLTKPGSHAEATALPLTSSERDPEQENMMQFQQAISDGAQLTAEQADALAKEVAAHLDDQLLRAKLLGYYTRPVGPPPRSAEAAEKAQPLFLWFIQNAPDSATTISTPMMNALTFQPPALGQELRAAWEAQMQAHPDNPQILFNVGIFLALHDRDRALALLRRARTLHPDQSSYTLALTQLLTWNLSAGEKNAASGERFPPGSPAELREAYDLYRKLNDAAKSEAERTSYLNFSSGLAYRLGDRKAAIEQARQVIAIAAQQPDKKADYGNITYNAHTLLGLIALEEGNASAAKEQLMASVDLPETTQIYQGITTPNYHRLAQRLLEQGDRDLVITYLEKFPAKPEIRRYYLAPFMDLLRQGQTPNLTQFPPPSPSAPSSTPAPQSVKPGSPSPTPSPNAAAQSTSYHDEFNRATELAVAGRSLTSEQAAQLLREIEQNPDQVDLRMKLLGYYSPKRLQLGPEREAFRDAALVQIQWIIEHRPEWGGGACYGTGDLTKRLDPARYEVVSAAWKAQVARHPDDARVLANAAAFELLSDRTETEKLLRRAHELEPANNWWTSRLAEMLALYSQDSTGPASLRQRQEVLSLYLAMMKTQSGVERFYTLTTITEAALQAENIPAAAGYARDLLEAAAPYKNNWNYGNAIYTANSVLGHLALREDDLPAAESYLLEAGATPGSPQLDSFGPDLTLAQKILDRGQQDTVITFLDEIGKFWEGRGPQIKAWQDAIRRGEKPKLDRNAAATPASPAASPQKASAGATSTYVEELVRANALLDEGPSLTGEEAAQYARELKANPEQIEKRIKLLGYYQRKRMFDESVERDVQAQLIWIITHHPASGLAGSRAELSAHKKTQPARYQAARAAWQDQIGRHPDDPRVLGNAAAFESLNNPKEALALYRRARALDPDNSWWASRLADLLTNPIPSGSNPQYPNAAAEAYAINQEMLKTQRGPERFYVLAATAQAALRVGDIPAAASYARELLETAPQYKGNWSYGNAVYAAHSVLGRIALQDGNLADAEKRLLAAGAIPHSPHLKSFGTGLMLAQLILAEGQRETVVTFLDQIEKSWGGQEDKVQAWKDAIRRGETPSFHL